MSRNALYEFREVERKIRPRSVVDVFKLENDFYTVSIQFFKEDFGMEEQTGKRTRLVGCKPKGANLILKICGEDVVIDDPELSFIAPQNVDDLIERLKIARDSAVALQKALADYK